MKISFVLNDKEVIMDVEPYRRVVDILREDLQLTGTKRWSSLFRQPPAFFKWFTAHTASLIFVNVP